MKFTMRTTLTVLTMFLATSPLHAFDVIGPPASSSISHTIRHVSYAKLLLVDCPNDPLQEVLDYIRGMEIPKKFGVIIDASRLRLPEGTRVKVVAKDVSILEAAGLVAEQLNANVLIEPGKIILVPKAKGPDK